MCWGGRQWPLRGGRRLASHNPFPKPHSSFPEHHSFHLALAKLPKQRGRFSSLLRPSWKSSTFFKKTTNYLSIAPLWREGRGYTRYLEKGSKGFSSRTKHPVNSRSSWCNSPGEAFHDGVRSIALRPPVPEKLEITETQTDTQNTAINIHCNRYST